MYAVYVNRKQFDKTIRFRKDLLSNFFPHTISVIYKMLASESHKNVGESWNQCRRNFNLKNREFSFKCETKNGFAYGSMLPNIITIFLSIALDALNIVNITSRDNQVWLICRTYCWFNGRKTKMTHEKIEGIAEPYQGMVRTNDDGGFRIMYSVYYTNNGELSCMDLTSVHTTFYRTNNTIHL